MLQPVRTKFRKQHKGRIKGYATSASSLHFGQYGLKAMEPERVTARQIEAARRALTRFMKRSGRVWIRVFPDVPVSKKPIEVRAGFRQGSKSAVGRAGQARPHHFESTARQSRAKHSLAAAKLLIKTLLIRIAE